MRIAHIIDLLYPGGAQTLLLTFAAEAQRRGIDLTIISLRQDERTSMTLVEQLKAAGARVVFFPHSRLVEPRQFWRLVQFLRQERFTVMQSHLRYANIIGTLAGRLAGIPVIGTLHLASINPGHRQSIFKLEGWLMQHLMPRVVAVGGVVAEVHRPRLGHRPISVIRNAVDSITAVTPEQRTALRTAIVGDPTRPIILAVGRLIQAKAYPDMFTAFAQVHAMYPQAALVIAGRGDQEATLKAQLAALNLDDSVYLLGSRNDVPQLLASSDIFINSSHTEGLPVAVLEAMSAGLPVVATDVGDTGFVIVEGTGIVVPPAHPDQLAAALLQLLDDLDVARTMGAAAQTHVHNHYNPAVWVDHLIALYAEVAPDMRSFDNSVQQEDGV